MEPRYEESRADESKDLQGGSRLLLPEVLAAIVRLLRFPLLGCLLDTLRVGKGLGLKIGD